jgi:hypothetical protein
MPEGSIYYLNNDECACLLKKVSENVVEVEEACDMHKEYALTFVANKLLKMKETLSY